VSSPPIERRLAAILSADIVGYSRLMGNDDEGTLQQRDRYFALISELAARHDGRTFGAAGDSVMAEFTSASSAVRCAVEIQQHVQRANLDLPTDHRMYLRIGVNLGDVIIEGENVYGDGVNVAARL
jgi:class 3 adenylate cyclase